MLGGARGPIDLLNLFLGGLMFGILALRTGGIVAPLAAHAGWNAIEELGLGLVPNPGISAFSALVNVDIIGHTLWGGNDAGLNSSLGTTTVLLAVVLLLSDPRTQARPAFSPHPPRLA